VLGEMIKPETAVEITQALQVPFIGIGCGNQCDGQIIVLSDILGMGENPPSFAKVFAEVGKAIQKGVSSYAEAVKDRTFPGKK